MGLALIGALGFLVMRKEDSLDSTISAHKTGRVVDIRIQATSFEPKDVTISLGDTVRFINEDAKARWPASNIHPTHEIYRAFDPLRAIEAGQEWSFAFERKGVWRFHDHLYPNQGGVINVE